MATEPLRYFVEVGGSEYEALTVKGTEGISLTARFEVTFHVPPNDGLDPNQIISGEAKLVLRKDTVERSIALWVTKAMRGATRKLRGGTYGGGEVKLVLEPRLAMLRARQDIRVFQNKTAPEIAQEVLSAMGVTVEQRLRETYVKRLYCVQFRESDYDFAARLLEDEGIHCFVNDEGVAVFGDHPTSYDESVASLPFRHGAGLDQNEDSVTAVGVRGVMTAGKVSLRDWNRAHPSMNMDVEAPGPTENGAEWYDYPGEYLEPGEGAIKAKKRAEALACVHSRTIGRSFCAALRPGARFQLREAPMGVQEGGYVLTRVFHDWRRDMTGFAVDFEALRESVTYRPEVTTYVPVEPNPLTGFTTGPSGADIHTNESGDVKVWFPWDRLQPKDDKCSDWFPILQDNTGKSVGIMRTRWEVLCTFLEGDPDRPVITGRVYNAEDPHYTPLPANKSRTSLRSLVSPRTVEGSNFIQFEDKAGFEAIMISANRDQNVVIGNDKNEQVDMGETLLIRGNEKIKIGNEQRIAVTKDLVSEIQANQTKRVGANRSVDAGKAQEETITQNHTLNIGGAHTRTAGSSDMTQVNKSLKETVGGVIMETSLKTNGTGVGEIGVLLVGGAHVELAQKSKVEVTGKEARYEVVVGNVMEDAGKELATRVEKKRTLKIVGSMKVDAKKNLLVAGAEKLKTKSATLALNAAKSLTIKVGENQIKLANGTIAISAENGINLEFSATNNQKSTTADQI